MAFTLLIALSLSILNCVPPEPSEIKKGSKKVGSKNIDGDRNNNGSNSGGNNNSSNAGGNSGSGDGTDNAGDDSNNGAIVGSLNLCEDGPQDYFKENIPKLINNICSSNFNDIIKLADANAGSSQVEDIQYIELISPAASEESANILEAMFVSSFVMNSSDLSAILTKLMGINQNADYNDALSEPGATFGPQGDYSANSEFFKNGWVIREKRVVEAGGGLQTANYDLERAIFDVDTKVVYLSDTFLNAIDERTVAVNRLHMIFPRNDEELVVVISNHLQTNVPSFVHGIAIPRMKSSFQSLVVEYQDLLKQ
ncbi:MAG: hypothetical protein HRU09_16270 [Oligoflexales bacterium]|nr:hypothetical protein [Oligoflexales bacterium]